MPFRDGITVFSQNTPYVCRAYPPDAPGPEAGEEVLDLETGRCIGIVVGAQAYSRTKKETMYRIFLTPKYGYKEAVNTAAMDKTFETKPRPTEYTKICPVCGNMFRTNRYNAVFCSRKCSGASKHKEQVRHICEYCGGEFYKKPSNKNRFCSYSCSQKWRMAVKAGKEKGEKV